MKLDLDLLAALKAIKQRDGINESEQIRRGIRLWLKQKDIEPSRGNDDGASGCG